VSAFSGSADLLHWDGQGWTAMDVIHDSIDDVVELAFWASAPDDVWVGARLPWGPYRRLRERPIATASPSANRAAPPVLSPRSPPVRHAQAAGSSMPSRSG
jgi:hypothetical protein